MSEFKIGDRVVVNESETYPWFNGHCGTIVCQRQVELWGIDFDESILDLFGYGHTCRGSARPGHGWFMVAPSLDLIPLDSVSIPDVADLL